MQEITCITCEYSLLDTGKLTADRTHVYCTVCNACYKVVPTKALDKTSPLYQKSSTKIFLDPVSPGNLEHSEFGFFKDSSTTANSISKDFLKIKKVIAKCTSAKDLLKSLKNSS